MTEGLRHAVLYAAKSTADPHGSIPTQLADGRAMAEREAWDVVGEHSDEAASAWSGDRGPGLTAAMEHAERVKGILLVQHSDRLARGDGVKARHLGEIYFWALKAEVEIRSVQDDSTFTNPLLTFAMGERNSEDSRRKSLSVAAGMKRRAEAGKPNGGPRPFGYAYASDGSGLHPVPAEAVIVRRIFREFVAGRSLTAIARGLQRDAIPTIRARHWRQSTITGVVRNPVYAGKVRNHGEIFAGVHEAIIDGETWQRAADLLAARPTRGRGRPPKGRHLFRAGLLRCECGEAMVPRTNGGYEMYYCNGRQTLGRDFCEMPHVRRALIDSAVYLYFETLGLDLEATRQQLVDARDRMLTEARALREDAEREAHAATERFERVRRHYQEGRIEADDWAEQRPQLVGERDAALAAAERHRAAEQDAQADPLADVESEVLRMLGDIRRAIAGEISDASGVDAVRAALTRLFSIFVLHPRQNAKYEGSGRAELVDVEEFMIEIQVREQALEGYDERLLPVLRREPLRQAENKQRIGLPIR